MAKKTNVPKIETVETTEVETVEIETVETVETVENINKVVKGNEFLSMSDTEQNDILISLLGSEKAEKQNSANFTSSNLPLGVAFQFVGFEGKGEENGEINERVTDTRYLNFNAKVTENDLLEYSVTRSNLLFRGVPVSEILLTENDLKEWSKDNGARKGLYIKDSKSVNDFLPTTNKELIKLLLNPKARFKAKKVDFNNLAYNDNIDTSTNKTLAIENMQVRTVYELELLSK